MMEHAYTVSEIDQMRNLVRQLIEGPTLHWEVHSNGSMAGGGRGWSYKESERAAQVEDRLRTYMLNGTTVEELREAVSEMDAQTSAAQERARVAALSSNSQERR